MPTNETLVWVAVAVTLAVTDAPALSRVLVAWFAQKLGVEAGAIRRYEKATDGEEQ